MQDRREKEDSKPKDKSLNKKWKLLSNNFIIPHHKGAVVKIFNEKDFFSWGVNNPKNQKAKQVFMWPSNVTKLFVQTSIFACFLLCVLIWVVEREWKKRQSSQTDAINTRTAACVYAVGCSPSGTRAELNVNTRYSSSGLRLFGFFLEQRIRENERDCQV